MRKLWIIILTVILTANVAFIMPVFAQAISDKPKSSEKQFSYVVAQGYFPEIPAAVWSDKTKIDDFINSINISQTKWIPWPILICLQLSPDALKTTPPAFFTTQKKFSVTTVMQVMDKNNKLLDYSGALLLETYQYFASDEDLVSGFSSILHSPKQGHIMTVFINFEPNPVLRKIMDASDSKIVNVKMANPEEDWSPQRKKDNINFLRLIMQPSSK